MLRVGLTGGLASGKSFVGDTFVSLGCDLLKADEVGHLLLEPNGDAYPLVVSEFGESILAEDGSIVRSRLAALVFGNAERLGKLNAIIHPLVLEAEKRFFDALAREEAEGAAARDNRPAVRIGIVEAAILIETGNFQNFDKIVVAWCPRETQIIRAIHRGLSREEALARLEHQIPLDDKRAFADAVVDTSGTKEETRGNVEALYRHMLEELA